MERPLRWICFPLATGLSLFAAGCASDKATSTSRRDGRSSAGTWAIQYEGPIVVRGRDYHIVDLFDVSTADLSKIHKAGSKPIAYFSSQYESWRNDAGKFPPQALGKPLDG